MKMKIIKLSVAVVLVMALAFSLMGAKAVGVNANASQYECEISNYSIEKTNNEFGIAPIGSFPYIEIRFSRFAIDLQSTNFEDITYWLDFSWQNQLYFELHLSSMSFCLHCMFIVVVRDDYFSFIVDASLVYSLFGWKDFTQWQTVMTHWFIQLAGAGMSFDSFSVVGFRYWFGDDGGANNAIIAELLAMIDSLNSQISSLHSQLLHANSLLNSTNINVNNLTNTVNNLTAELGEINMQLQNALDLISELEADNQGLSKIIAGLESDIADLENEIAYLENIIDGLNNGDYDDEDFSRLSVIFALAGLLIIILIIALIFGSRKKKGRY